MAIGPVMHQQILRKKTLLWVLRVVFLLGPVSQDLELPIFGMEKVWVTRDVAAKKVSFASPGQIKRRRFKQVFIGIFINSP